MYWARCDGTIVWRDDDNVLRDIFKPTPAASADLKRLGIVITGDPVGRGPITPERRAAIKRWYDETIAHLVLKDAAEDDGES